MQLDGITTSTPGSIQFVVTVNATSEQQVNIAVDAHGLISSLHLQPTGPTPTTTTPATAAKKTIRIRFGSSEALTDSSGNVWEGERGINGGSTVDRDAGLAVANTKDAAMFRSEHYSMDDITLSVPNGKYIAKLYFAETYDGITGPGQRVFSFNVQGHEFKDFDVWVKAGGPNKACVETVPVEVTNGEFKIVFTPNIENPQINAIEISPLN